MLPDFNCCRSVDQKQKSALFKKRKKLTMGKAYVEGDASEALVMYKIKVCMSNNLKIILTTSRRQKERTLSARPNAPSKMATRYCWPLKSSSQRMFRLKLLFVWRLRVFTMKAIERTSCLNLRPDSTSSRAVNPSFWPLKWRALAIPTFRNFFRKMTVCQILSRNYYNDFYSNSYINNIY